MKNIRQRLTFTLAVSLAGATHLFGLFGMGDTVVVVGDPLRESQWALELKQFKETISYWKDQVKAAQDMLNDTTHMVQFMGDMGSVLSDLQSIHRDINDMGDSISGFEFPDSIDFDYRINPNGTPPTTGFAVEAGAYREVIGSDILIEGEFFEERNAEDFKYEDLRMKAYDTYSARIAHLREAMDEEGKRQQRMMAELNGGELTEAKMSLINTSMSFSSMRMDQYRASMEAAKAEYEGTLSDIETEERRQAIAQAQEDAANRRYQEQRYNESLARSTQATINANNARVTVPGDWWSGLSDAGGDGEPDPGS
jgi:hypothetical protein